MGSFWSSSCTFGGICFKYRVQFSRFSRTFLIVWREKECCWTEVPGHQANSSSFILRVFLPALPSSVSHTHARTLHPYPVHFFSVIRIIQNTHQSRLANGNIDLPLTCSFGLAKLFERNTRTLLSYSIISWITALLNGYISFLTSAGNGSVCKRSLDTIRDGCAHHRSLVSFSLRTSWSFSAHKHFVPKPALESRGQF